MTFVPYVPSAHLYCIFGVSVTEYVPAFVADCVPEILKYVPKARKGDYCVPL